MHKGIIIATAFMLLLSTSAYAINLGGTQKSSFAEISISDSAKFRMLFWNAGNETYKVSLSAQSYPSGWDVIISPSEFYLDSNTGDESLVLPYMQNSVMARSVDIFVKPNANSPPGSYHVTIRSDTNLPEINASGMNVLSERLFDFAVNITGTQVSANESQQKEVAYDSANSSQNTSVIASDGTSEDKTLFYSAVVILVAISSIIIYKRYK
jgi:uncharacterized membrane protein